MVDNVIFDVQKWEAWRFCFLLSFMFVTSLYLVPPRIRSLRRDEPIHIIARFVCISLATFGSLLILRYMASVSTSTAAVPISVWIGHTAIHETVEKVSRSLLIISCLYAGPILCMFLLAFIRRTHDIDVFGNLRPAYKRQNFCSAIWSDLVDKSNFAINPWIACRNLVFGPVTEEIVFRGCFSPVLLCGGVSLKKIIFVSPWIFGLAHAHHIKEGMRDGKTFMYAALPVLMQLAYTSIFGMFASFIHLRTGCIYAPIMCHMFCNLMGLPDFSFAIPPKNYATSGPLSSLYGWSKIIWCSYAIGILAFCYLLFPATENLSEISHLWQYQDINNV